MNRQIAKISLRGYSGRKLWRKLPLRPFLLIALAAFVTLSTASAQNTARACLENSEIKEQYRNELLELQPVLWAKTYSSEAASYLGELNRGIANGFVIANLDYLSRELKRPAPTSPKERLAFQLTLRPVLVRAIQQARAIDDVNDLELQAGRLEQQFNLRVQREKDLNCGNLAAAGASSPAGSLQRADTKLLGKDRSGQGYEYRYTETSAVYLIIGDPPDRREVKWEFKGIPASLTPKDEFTITVTGKLNMQPPGAERGANYSAGVRTEGLTAIKEENAYFYQGASRTGTYTYRVPEGAKKVVIAIGADNNIGVFAVYCYGECKE